MAATSSSSPSGDAFVHVICNPAAGSRSSLSLLERKVLPLLTERLSSTPSVHYTEVAGDGERIGREIATSAAGETNLILLGGDGTTNEVLNGILAAPSSKTRARYNLSLIPTGTANALYAALYPPPAAPSAEEEDDDAWRLRSLKALLSSLSSGEAKPSHLSPLTFFDVTIQPPSSAPDAPAKKTYGHLVVSHALHASILSDSEALRSQMPGVERFKVAAERNSVNWVRGKLKLLPYGVKGEEAGTVQRYESRRQRFVDVDATSEGEATLQGPFVYLTALVTDRLESNFVPAPFSGFKDAGAASHLARPKAAMDIVLIRPLRDPAVSRALPVAAAATADKGDGEHPEWPLELRIDFAKSRLTQITKGMYDGGAHVRLRYAEGGDEEGHGQFPDLVEEGGGEEAVEYFRVGGYEWVPDKDDDKAKLTCVDGAIYEGSRTTVTATAASSGSGENSQAPEISVWH